MKLAWPAWQRGMIALVGMPRTTYVDRWRRKLGVHPYWAYKMAGELEAAGLLRTRKRGRVRIIGLTAAGQSIADALSRARKIAAFKGATDA